MKRLAVLAVTCAALPALSAADQRVLEIVAPSQTDARYQRQAAELLAAWDGLVDRDVTVRTRFGGEAFRIILIGKDGTEKLRRTTELPVEELFARIDAMPMRRAEIEARK